MRHYLFSETKGKRAHRLNAHRCERKYLYSIEVRDQALKLDCPDSHPGSNIITV